MIAFSRMWFYGSLEGPRLPKESGGSSKKIPIQRQCDLHGITHHPLVEEASVKPNHLRDPAFIPAASLTN
jgi:hypothetical protein